MQYFQITVNFISGGFFKLSNSLEKKKKAFLENAFISTLQNKNEPKFDYCSFETILLHLFLIFFLPFIGICC